MDKISYLSELKRYLQRLPESEINDILNDYEEHFSIGKEKGKTEQEISKELGDPKEVAKSIYASMNISYERTSAYINHSEKSPIAKIIILIGLLFFNLIIVLGAYLAWFGILFGIFITSVSLFASSIFILFLSTNVGFITTLALAIGFMGLSVLIFIGFIYLCKMTLRLSRSFFKWQLSLLN